MKKKAGLSRCDPTTQPLKLLNFFVEIGYF